MNSKGKTVRYVSALLVTVVFACASVIPAAKACVADLRYYVNIENPSPPNFYRSTTPFDFSTTNYDYLQWVTASGGIVTTLTPLTGGTTYVDLGFGYTYGKLGDITSIPIVGSGSYAVNIYVDMNTANDVGGNGPFFSWSGDAYNGLDGDDYGLGPHITDSGAITTASSFALVAHGYNTYTIAQLQSGAAAGIDSNTIVGFWFGTQNGVFDPMWFEIDQIGGQSVVCVSPPISAPVGGEWVPINTVQMLVRIVGSAAVMSAIAASFVGFKRFKRKQD